MNILWSVLMVLAVIWFLMGWVPFLIERRWRYLFIGPAQIIAHELADLWRDLPKEW